MESFTEALALVSILTGCVVMGVLIGLALEKSLARNDDK